MSYLLENGARVNGADGTRPPIVWAVQEAQFDAFKILLQAGADVCRAAGELDDETALSMAAEDERLAFLKAIVSSGRAIEAEHLQQVLETAEAYGEERAATYLRRFIDDPT